MGMRQVRWSLRTERPMCRVMLWWLPVALLGCSATGALDAGADAGDSSADAGDSGVDGRDAGNDVGEPAPSCREQFRAAVEGFRTSQAQCLSGEPEVTRNVTFRVRNAGVGDVWVPRELYYGFVCQGAITVTTCAGAVVQQPPGATPSGPSSCGQSELCYDELLRLVPDASVEYSWPPYVRLSFGCGCQATTGLPAGSYSARFAYSGDGSHQSIYPSTADQPFVLSADSGVIDFVVP
jgi:hypothetical protein